MNETIYPFPSELVDDTGRVIADIGCPCCGYNLRDKLLDGPCPKCGARLLPLLARLFDLKGNFTADFLCSSCRYDLRSLTWKHRCPECGQPVAESLRHPVIDRRRLFIQQTLRAFGRFLFVLLIALMVLGLIGYIWYRYG